MSTTDGEIRQGINHLEAALASVETAQHHLGCVYNRHPDAIQGDTNQIAHELRFLLERARAERRRIQQAAP